MSTQGFAPPADQQVTIMRSIGPLTFDAVLTEEHSSELQVTTNPVETGVAVADHCFMQPLRVRIAAVVSDLKMPSASNLYDDTSSRARRAFEFLQYLQTDLAAGNAEPFDVATGLRLYEHMVCVSLTATQDAETASLLSFEAELQEIITVDTQTATYTKARPMPGKPTRQGTQKKEQGDKQPEKVEEAVGSLIKGIGNGLKKGVEDFRNWTRS